MIIIPKISIILTSCNQANYLREAIDSVLAQTFSDFELIIWDDASTDQSWQITTGYSDPRIRRLRDESNRHIGSVRAVIEQTVRGRYIAIHNSEHVWEPEKLEKQARFLDTNPQIGAVFSWAQIIDKNGLSLQDQDHFYNRLFEQPNRTRYEWLNYFFYHGNALCHSSVLIRKQCYEECGLYRHGLAQLPDFDMWVRLCMLHEIHVLPEKLVRFRVQGDEPNTRKPERRIQYLFDSLQIYKNYLQIQNKEEFLRVFPESSIYIDEKCNGDIQYALARLALSLRHNPPGQLFGLQILFDILQDPKHFAVIQESYGFRMKDFFDLTAQYDIFGRETLLTRDTQLAECAQQVQTLDRQIAAIYASRSWRVMALIRAVGAKLRWMKERVRASVGHFPVFNSPSISVENARVKIAAVTMVYNEALILPYFLRHYRYLDEIHVLYETDSTDESLAILMQAPNVMIKKCHIEGGLDDIKKIKLINQTVQKIKADWVYVVDPDEFIFPPNNESPHDFLKRQFSDVVRSGMYQVYRHRTDKDLDPSLAPIPQRIHGDPNLFSTDSQANRAPNVVYIKPNIVRPSKRIRFSPGHHQIEGDLQTSPELYVGAHWQMADPSIAIARRMERKARISKRNRKHQMGWQHFDISVDKIMEECERHLDDPIIDALYSFSEMPVQNLPPSIRPGNFSGRESDGNSEKTGLADEHDKR